MQKRVLDSIHRQIETKRAWRGVPPRSLIKGNHSQEVTLRSLFQDVSGVMTQVAQALGLAWTLLTTWKTGNAVATFSNSASGASLFTGTWGLAPGARFR